MRSLLFVLTVGVTIAASGQARAQYVPPPDGSLALPNGNGTYTIIHPPRLLPGAEVVGPGSVRQTPNGSIWLTGGGRVGGNLTDPSGNLHLVRLIDQNARSSVPKVAQPGT